VFEWLDGRAYLVQRCSVPEPAPTSTWIIGSDEAAESYTALYYDPRGVSRVYRMSVSEGVWTVWQDAPGFFQRFTGTFGRDNTTITGRWEWSDDGSIAQAEGTPYKEEAQVAYTMAQKILLENGLTMSEVDALTADEQRKLVANEEMTNMGKRHVDWLLRLARIIARNFRVRHYIYHHRWGKYQTHHIRMVAWPRT
jgi:hypothetical protein